MKDPAQFFQQFSDQPETADQYQQVRGVAIVSIIPHGDHWIRSDETTPGAEVYFYVAFTVGQIDPNYRKIILIDKNWNYANLLHYDTNHIILQRIMWPKLGRTLRAKIEEKIGMLTV